MKTIEAVACYKCSTLHALHSEDLVFFNGRVTRAANSNLDNIVLDGEYPFCIVCLIQFLREELQGTVFRG